MEENAVPGVCMSMLRRLISIPIAILGLCLVLGWLGVALGVALSCGVCVFACFRCNEEGAQWLTRIPLWSTYPFLLVFAVGGFAMGIAFIPVTLVPAIVVYVTRRDRLEAIKTLFLPITLTAPLVVGLLDP